MEWSEIYNLANTLHEVQSLSSTNSLSKSNWIDIINYLHERKRVNLIFSECGQFMMTTEYVKNYILEQIEKENGFLDLVKISRKMQVFLKDIKNVVKFVLKENKDFCLVEDKLYSEKFYEELAEKINSSLQEKMCLKLYDFSVEHNIPYKVIKKIILEKTATVIEGKLNKNEDFLYTNEAMNRCKAIIKGITMGTLKIISIDKLRERVLKIDAAYENIFDLAINSNEFCGRIVKSFGTIPTSFMPAYYEHKLTAHIITTINSSGVLNYKFYRNRGIRDVLNFVTTLANDLIIHLSTCCITVTKSENLKFQIISELNKKQYVDLFSALPEEFEEEDICPFLELIDLKSSDLNFRVEKNRWIILEEYVKSIFDKLISEMDQYAQNHLKDFKFLGSQENKIFKKPPKKREKTKKNKSRKMDEDKRNDFEENEKNLYPFFSKDEYVEFLKAYFPSTDEFYELIFELLNDVVICEFQNFAKNAIENSKRLIHYDLKTQIKSIRGYLSIQIPRLLCYHKGIQFLGEDLQNIHTTFEKHLLRNLGFPIADSILRECAFRENLIENDYFIDSDKNRNFLIDHFDSFLKSDFKSLYDSLKATIPSTKSFLELFEKLIFSQFGFNLPKLDKRCEKEIVLAKREHLRELLKSQTDKPSIFLTAISLIFNVVQNATLLIPGKFVGKVFHLLSNKLTPAEIELLTKSERIAIKNLKSLKEGNFAEDEEDDEVYNNLTMTILSKHC